MAECGGVIFRGQAASVFDAGYRACVFDLVKGIYEHPNLRTHSTQPLQLLLVQVRASSLALHPAVTNSTSGSELPRSKEIQHVWFVLLSHSSCFGLPELTSSYHQAAQVMIDTLLSSRTKVDYIKSVCSTISRTVPVQPSLEVDGSRFAGQLRLHTERYHQPRC